jgi:signal transduction histidine kinase
VALAQDLLVLARADRGTLPIAREEVSLPDLVGSVCEAYRRRAEEAGVALDVEVAAERASVDPARMRQALVNLLDNAIRATPRGGSVTVRATRRAGAVDLIVEDSGPGFSSSVRGHEFEPFVRSDQQAHADGGGAGLGLAIVRAVAEAHGGTAAADDRPGGGARLTLTFRE